VREVAEEGYGLQVSLKDGDDMFNARGADADELVSILDGLMDAADNNDTAAWIVGRFSIGEDKPKTSRSNGGSKRRSSSSGGGMKNPDGEPSDKQLDFAKKLGIRGANRMSKAEVSEAIDAKLADRDADDDDD
jgi:hypothetical protein